MKAFGIGCLTFVTAVAATAGPSAPFSSITCQQINGTSIMAGDLTTGKVTLTIPTGVEHFDVESVRTSSTQTTLVARSPDNGHLLAFILPRMGQSTIQYGGTYFYARCK